MSGDVEALAEVLGEIRVAGAREADWWWAVGCSSRRQAAAVLRAALPAEPEGEASVATERIEAAKKALIATGYFTPDQVGDDIAPRITELWSAVDPYLEPER